MLMNIFSVSASGLKPGPLEPSSQSSLMKGSRAAPTCVAADVDPQCAVTSKLLAAVWTDLLLLASVGLWNKKRP